MRPPSFGLFVLTIFAFALPACHHDTLQPQSLPAVPAELGVPVKLRIGQIASYNEGILKVAFDTLLEDSRCPIEYLCVEAGEVRLKLPADYETLPAAQFELRTSSLPLAGYDYAGFRIEYVNLEPYPSVANPPRRSDYRLSILVTPL